MIQVLGLRFRVYRTEVKHWVSGFKGHGLGSMVWASGQRFKLIPAGAVI